MSPRSDSDFEYFLRACNANLRRIAAATRGEATPDDVRQEAWVVAQWLREAKGIAPDFADAAYQQTLLAHLYGSLVKYAETSIRYAVRLDQWTDADGVADIHPIARGLRAAESTEPIAALLAKEATNTQAPMPSGHLSPASAYLVLLRTFDNRMRAVADFLLISISHCYRCYGKALKLAISQTPMPDTLGDRNAILPRPWRRYRAIRPPIQLELNFGPEQMLWAVNERPLA